MKDTIDYKFVFVAIIISYYIAQFVIIQFKPDVARYMTLLQIPFFLISIIIINENNNFFSKYKIRFKFPARIIPVMLWALVGISLIQIGSDILIKQLLPNFLLQHYNLLYRSYMNEVNSLLVNNSRTILEFCTISFCIAIIPAVCEELFFRGYLMQNIKENNSKFFAIIISALLFSIIHLNPISFIYIFILGLYLGHIFYKTGSIIPAMILHFLNNFIIVLSSNFYYGNEMIITNIPFGIICIVVGGGVMLSSIKITSQI